MKIYISGKITGLTKSDYESLFNTAEEQLRQIGYEICNPVKIHGCCNHPQTGNKYAWKQYMLCDIKALLDCDGIYMLPNWKESKAARIEHAIAIETAMKVLYQPN